MNTFLFEYNFGMWKSWCVEYAELLQHMLQLESDLDQYLYGYMTLTPINLLATN